MRKARTLAWLAAPFLLLQHPLQAAEINRVLTVPVQLKSAMAVALAEHPKTGAARSELAAAALQVEGGKYRWLPVFSSGIKTGRTGDRAASLSLKQPIWDGGRIEGEYDLSVSRAGSATAGVDAAKDDVRQRALLAYLNVARAREQIKLAEKNVAEHQSAHQSILAREVGGLGTRSDVTLVLSRLQQAKASLRQWQGEHSKAVSYYLAIVGKEPGTELGEFALLKTPELDNVQQVAIKRSPSLQRLRTQIDAAEASARVARAALSPTLSAQLSRTKYLGSSSYVDSLNHNSDIWKFGFNVEWANDVGLSQRYRADASDRQVDAARQQLAAGERELIDEVSGYWNDLLSAAERIESLRVAADAASENVGLSRRQFIIGRRSWPEVVNTLSDLYSTGVQLVDSKYSAYAAAGKLGVALGQFDE